MKNRVEMPVESFSFTNKWTDRENKSGAGAVLENIH